MGTNFYIDKKQTKHIGKRSSAGFYCWDCDITLCKQGNDGIHHEESRWYKTCPKCGKEPEIEKLTKNSTGRELGFNKTKPNRKKGVKSCSSFRWAIYPNKLKKIKKVYNEYGDKLSIKEFNKMLSECPIQYLNSIGDIFF